MYKSGSSALDVVQDLVVVPTRPGPYAYSVMPENRSELIHLDAGRARQRGGQRAPAVDVQVWEADVGPQLRQTLGDTHIAEISRTRLIQATSWAKLVVVGASLCQQ